MPDMILILIRIIARETGVSAGHILGPTRKREMVDAREIFVRICRDTLHMSYPQIARELKRDHTSIMHLYNRKLSYEPTYTKILAEFIQKVG